MPPLYRGIADQLRGELAGLTDGQLPSEGQLTKRFAVTRSTIRRALKVLLDEDLIVARQGRRCRVYDPQLCGAHTHRTIADVVLARISSGQIPGGAMVPPNRELTAQFHVSRDTVRRAMIALEAAGHIEARRGIGWFVV